MDILAFGQIKVTTPGTSVPVTADPSIKVNAIVVSQVPGSTGITVLGLQNAVNPVFNRTTGAGVVKSFLPAGASGFLNTHTVQASQNSNVLVAADYRVDAAVANEGLYAYGIRV